MQNQRTFGFLALLVTALLWSFLGLLGKIALHNGLDPFTSAYFRTLFAAIAFFLHCACTGALRVPVKDAATLALFGAWGIGVYYSCAQYTILHSGAAMDIILQYTAPFWVTLFARLFFRETLVSRQWVALFLSALGALLVCLSGGSIQEAPSLAGIATGIVSGICYASHYPFTRIWQRKYGAPTIFFYMLLGGVLYLSLLTGFLSPSLPKMTPVLWLSTGAMGLACTYCAFLFFAYGIRRIGLVEAAITSEAEPVLSIFWVWLIFNEHFPTIGWAGSFLILFSVFITSLGKKS
ncbi:MAG: EamA family transporter [Desulfovibrionaceae bacterium]|nr:EamA family transporter [Desulfovibrionaceae bacterium]